ncbi:hypothetical protein GENT5_16330 [Flavobacterium ammoniigenes]|uniref:EF-hand domain-containing protein n=1 Tax=Flavobacterium ammoniigenes TaxID=1751095 RepID=A0ABN6L3Z8_9FLAO|nr:serine hydrolase [Flavobacterium ammoniigenes]BDB55328.1 hypothetical protein GENT5_16330 [Flavobacterium ammoniigenes]
MLNIKYIFFSIPFLCSSCVISNNALKSNPLNLVLESQNPKIQVVMDNAREHELQIIYTQINRDKDGKISFQDYQYNVNSKNYFYPASTVKLPIALLAVEKLNSMNLTTDSIHFRFDEKRSSLHFQKEISKLFALSDNDAANNLIEFTGFDYINSKMKEKGLVPFSLNHRLSSTNSSNKITSSILLYKNDNLIAELPSLKGKNVKALHLNSTKKGIGYLENDSIVKGAFDFSAKNYYPLETLHSTLKRLLFPQEFKLNERFNLNETDRQFILSSMYQLPREQGFDAKEFYDSYCKFFIFGDTTDTINSSIKIYNKIGQAYGTLTDCAYINDEKNGVEFMVTATLLVNKNKIFNDGIYEYDEIGIPFLAELGRQLYTISKSK